MKVYCELPQPSLGLQRIRDALVRYAPASIQIVPTEAEAELVIIYAIGRRDHLQRQVDYLLSTGRKYAIIQVCLRSTLSPRTYDWWSIWKSATCFWSYYDLRQAMIDDRQAWGLGPFNFYHAPLGVDAQVFYPRHSPSKPYVITTCGHNRLQESIRECILAAEVVGRDIFHLGRQVNWGYNVVSGPPLSDDDLADVYSESDFVSGLRRTEGFELPAAEGLLCGARPIVFDTPDYHFNYREFAEYVHEGTRAEVVDQLVQLFKQGARPVTAHEREEAAHWFNWERIIGGFYQRLL